MGEFENCIRKFIVQKILKKEDESILKGEDSLVQSGIIDSLGIILLISFLEKEYRIAVPEEELYPENFETIEAISALVKKIKKGSSYGDIDNRERSS
jgi:acyl carrier protein